jgi:hypothetical protein
MSSVSARRSWLVLGLVLVAGILLGVTGMAIWIHTRLHALHTATPQELDALGLSVLDHQLDLDAQQEQQARAIVHRVHERLAGFHHAHAEELQAILGDASRELKAILRPDQVVDWDDLHERIVEHLLMSGFLDGHGPGAAPHEEVPTPPSAPSHDGG